MATDNLKCTCGKEITLENTYSFGGISKCKDCFFKEGSQGPLQEQYKKCPSCSTDVHTFTIKCPKCGAQIHETGTITVRRTIKGGMVMAYGFLVLVLLITALVIPGQTKAGWIAYPITLGGFALSVHGFLGVLFFMLPFGFKTLNNLTAFLLGFAEAAAGVLIMILPLINK